MLLIKLRLKKVEGALITDIATRRNIQCAPAGARVMLALAKDVGTWHERDARANEAYWYEHDARASI